MSKIISLKIDVSKIDKSRLFQGKKGTYLDAVLFLNDDIDDYGNNGMIVQSVTQEEREAGTKGAILGNSKQIGGEKKEVNYSEPASAMNADSSNGNLPF